MPFWALRPTDNVATMTLARALYSLLVWAAQPLLKHKLRRRAKAEPGYGHAIAERFGHYQPSSLGRDGAGQWIWIHAVSLGETRAAAVLLKHLRTHLPSMRLLLTHGTATGRAEGEKLLQPGDVQVWLPWDTPGAVQRFIQQFRPLVGVLMETEVWPNLVAACQQARIPLVLANARLNAKSLAGAQRWSALSRPAYAGLSAVLAQSAEDADRLRSLGAPVTAIMGNLKFDAQPDAILLAQGAAWRAASSRPVLLLASSREDEEAQWLAQWRAQPAMQRFQWLIVPRHPQRFCEVADLLTQAGLRVARRSQWGERLPPHDADVWLGDSLGEMTLYYACAQVALLGGSFAPLGGQNLIEAAACACPIIVGPHSFNFAQVAEQACCVGAALRVLDMAQGVDQAIALAQHPRALAQSRQAALAFAQAHRGAAQATAQAIARLLVQSHS